MRACAGPLLLMLVASSPAWAQPVPQPFPRTNPPPPSTSPAPTPESPASPNTPPASTTPAQIPPTEMSLGLPIHPGAQFIASYDAGMGQRYYIFGSATPFAELVTYYRNTLKQRGELVFDEPATHMFEVGRFREGAMAFPPGVTIKDYTWGNLGGYLNPKAGAQPQRFPTIIQIVPAAAPER